MTTLLLILLVFFVAALFIYTDTSPITFVAFLIKKIKDIFKKTDNDSQT